MVVSTVCTETMSGSKRKSHYRKGVMAEHENTFPEPGDGEAVCRVTGSRGSSMFEVSLPESEEKSLAILPRKFLNLIWLKRNDFIIVENIPDTLNTDVSAGGSKVRLNIKHILKKEQIAHLKKMKLWPEKFNECIESNDSRAYTGDIPLDMCTGGGDGEDGDLEIKDGDEAEEAPELIPSTL